MIYYRDKHGVKMAEVWYNYAERPERKVDILRYKFVAEDKPEAASYEDLWTLLIDLSKPEDDIFSRVNKTAKYQINRAKNKDAVQCFTHLAQGEQDQEKLSQYIDFFNAFADSKGRSHIDYADLAQFFESGLFCVRGVRQGGGDNNNLTMHAYVVSDNTARLHQSSSLFRAACDKETRSMIGRSNRLLHWEDILYFKDAGLRWYDFGGWYGGPETTGTYAEQLLINQFKESFGGEKKREYSFIVPVSLKGRIAVHGRAVLKAMQAAVKGKK